MNIHRQSASVLETTPTSLQYLQQDQGHPWGLTGQHENLTAVCLHKPFWWAFWSLGNVFQFLLSVVHDLPNHKTLIKLSHFLKSEIDNAALKRVYIYSFCIILGCTMKWHFAYKHGNECRKVVKYIDNMVKYITKYDGSCYASQWDYHFEFEFDIWIWRHIWKSWYMGKDWQLA